MWHKVAENCWGGMQSTSSFIATDWCNCHTRTSIRFILSDQGQLLLLSYFWVRWMEKHLYHSTTHVQRIGKTKKRSRRRRRRGRKKAKKRKTQPSDAKWTIHWPLIRRGGGGRVNGVWPAPLFSACCVWPKTGRSEACTSLPYWCIFSSVRQSERAKEWVREEKGVTQQNLTLFYMWCWAISRHEPFTVLL